MTASDRDRGGGPPEDAYGRVTNPERFTPVLAAAERLVARLEAGYDVARVDPGDPSDGRVTRQVALAPTAGAPLVFRWTDFPGVRVSYGRWHDENYPQCGCDACDEQPGPVIEELEAKVEAVLTGRFRERVFPAPDGWWLEHSFDLDEGVRSGRTRLSPAHGAHGRATDLAWPPWPRRER